MHRGVVQQSVVAVVATLGAVLLVTGPASSRNLVALVAAAACLVQAVWLRRRARRDRRERHVWRWAAWTAAATGLGLVLEVVLGLGQGAGHRMVGLGIAAGTGAAAVLLYQGVLHWNRFKTYASDPGDWLNGLSAVAVAVAGGGLLIRSVEAPMSRWPDLQLSLWLSQVGALIVVLGTTVTIANLGGLRSDRRVWMLAGVTATVTLGTVLTASSGDARLTQLSVQGGWILLVTTLSLGSLAVPVRPAPQRATSQAPAIGALVVLAVSVGVLIANGLADTVGRESTTVFAGIAAVGSALRMVRLVGELAELALSRHEALTDDLTGMANRRALTAALEEAEQRRQPAALLIIDLDRFKQVNDRYGHGIGDEVLRIVALRLQADLTGSTVLARIGGDEFAVLLRGSAAKRATETAWGLFAACTDPVEVDGRRARLGASIGVAGTDLVGGSSEELMRRADAAMYVAKRAGGGVNTYDEHADVRARREHDLLEDLHAVIGADSTEQHREQIVVHFQPQVDVTSGTVVGAEALVRWDHPEHGLLYPDAFLDLVERHDLMPELTGIVLRRTAQEVAHWQQSGFPVRAAVNLSTSCLNHPDLLPFLDEITRDALIDPGLLVLEITETTLMSDPSLALEVVSTIAERGIAISIDDYGTGYSSLTYLNDLPAEELKLDRAFTARVAQEPRTAAIVAGTIDLAHHLGLRIVAEGVEDEETLVKLAALGCDHTQGYLHARPMPAEHFRHWLAEADGRSSPSPKTATAPRS
ncbi:MAG: putative bifunctional diguanylate cyclase/phosphodiesterase [Actinomycetota bacterium]